MRAALLILLITTTLFVQAQYNGRKFETINFDSFESGLKLSGEYEKYRIKTRGQEYEGDRTHLREGIFAKTKGSVVHPKLLSFYIDGTIQYEQIFITDRDDETGWWYEGEVLLDILKDHPYPVHLGWYRTQRDFDNPFSYYQTSITENWDAEVRWRNDWVPLHAFFNYSTFETNSHFNDKRETTVGLEGHVAKNKGHTKAKVWYTEFDETNHEYTEENAEFQNEHYFDDDKLRLITNARYRNRENLHDQRVINVFQSFQYKIFHKFYLAADGRYQNIEYQNSEQNTYAGRTGYRFQLYDNFKQYGYFHAIYNETDDYDAHQYGPELGITYFRTTLIGKFSADYNVRLFHDHASSNQEYTAIVGETHDYTTGTSIQLTYGHIDASSIIVTDPTGSIIYVEGLDYTISNDGVFTYIEVPVGSSITSGSSIVIDYRYRNRGYRGKRVSQHLNLGWGYKGFSVFYDLVDNKYHDLVGEVDIKKSRRQILAGQYLNKYMESRVKYTISREGYIPYDQIALHQQFSYSFSDQYKLQVYGDYVLTENVDSNEKKRAIYLGCALHSQISHNFNVITTAQYVKEKNGEDLEGYSFTLKADYKYRAWHLTGKYRMRMEDIDDNERDFHEIFVEATKSF